MADLKLYDLPPSPNNMKAHIALNYKELTWESIPIDMEDRSNLVKLSGQPFAPILVHGETVVFDSSAILRYLDANFRETRPLFSSDPNTMRKIEEWEGYCRSSIAAPVGMCFGEAFAEQKNEENVAQAFKKYMGIELSDNLADLIINRQIQRLETYKNYEKAKEL